METQLYFWKPLIEQYKKSLMLVREYYDRTKVIFDNIEEEAQSYTNSLYDNFGGSEYTDPASVAEWAQEEGLERYETLAIMKSNHLMMAISMLYHMWEQQIIKFTIKELSHNIVFSNKTLSYAQAQNIFRLHNADMTSVEAWPKIEELKLFVNTVKHGDGKSAKKLRKRRPDYFESNLLLGTDILDLNNAVLLDEFSLQVKETDLYTYINAVVKFWDEMPEIAYADVQIIIDELNKKNDKSTF